MPIFYQLDIKEDTKLAIWHIEENETFFREKVFLNKDIAHPNKRLQHLAGRYLLRYLFPDFPLEEIKIADSRKPYLKTERYHFSISHCGSYAAALVSRSQRVGIDIEIPAKKVAKVQHKFLNDAERQSITSIFENKEKRSDASYEKRVDHLRLLTTLWSAKEAIYKWYSFGKVNFKENIHLHPFSFETAGNFSGFFLKDSSKHSLRINYKVFQELSMAWVTEE